MEDFMEYIVNVYQKDNGYCYNSTYDNLHDAQIAVDEICRTNQFLSDELKFHGNITRVGDESVKSFDSLVELEF